jgi:HEAT repeat protein
VGFGVDEVRDLRHLGTRYQAAIPVLTRWLPVATHDAVRDDIIHALGVPWATAAAPALVAEFRRAAPGPGRGQRWSIASALSDAAHDAVFDDVVELVRDRAYGRDREMLALALGRMSDPRAVAVLLELATDDEVCGHAAMALGRLRAPAAERVLRELARHPRRWVRREATKALKRIAG